MKDYVTANRVFAKQQDELMRIRVVMPAKLAVGLERKPTKTQHECRETLKRVLGL